jgi:UDP-galactopyranose mutase
MTQTIAIAGAGFSGAIVARELAERAGLKVCVFEARDHIAGNCHSERDPDTGVMVHVYGAHVFHTSREKIWEYVNRFATFRRFHVRIFAVTHRGVFSLPINLLTLNQFFGKVMSPEEAERHLEQLCDTSIENPSSFEEQALRFVGRDIYEAFFEGYTRKQWGISPSRLPASILRRLPIRFNYNNDYFQDTWQGIPEEGYTALIGKILDHPNIEVRLSTRFKPETRDEFSHVFFTGPLDAFFEYRLGRLGYRTLRFDRFVHPGDYQGNAVVTYCQESVPYTRIIEHKHLTPWERHEKSLCHREFSHAAKPGDTPFYPLRLLDDKALLQAYCDLAEQTKDVTFLGRLGTYRYLDMHEVIAEALDVAERFLKHHPDQGRFDTFSVSPV